MTDIIEVVERGLQGAPGDPGDPGSALDNLVLINKESDFETQDATTITLDPTKLYEIGASFSHSKAIIASGSSIRGLSEATVMSYTGTDSQFKNVESRASIKDIYLSAPNGTVFECIGDDTGDPNHRYNVGSVFVIDCEKVLKSDGCGAQVFDLMQVANISGNKAFEFIGSSALIYDFSKIGIFGLVSGAVAFDFGTSVSSEISLTNIIAVGHADAVAISGLANSGNLEVGSKATVQESNFRAFTNPLTNIVFDDVRWNFRDTPLVRDTRNAADCFLTSPQIVTIGGGNSGTFFNIGGANWSFTVDHRFTISSSGIVTYIGEDAIDVKVSCSLTLEKDGGGSDVLEARVGLNGTSLPRSAANTENNSPTSIPLECFISITTGDEITLMVANMGGTTDINVTRTSALISG